MAAQTGQMPAHSLHHLCSQAASRSNTGDMFMAHCRHACLAFCACLETATRHACPRHSRQHTALRLACRQSMQDGRQQEAECRGGRRHQTVSDAKRRGQRAAGRETRASNALTPSRPLLCGPRGPFVHTPQPAHTPYTSTPPRPACFPASAVSPHNAQIHQDAVRPFEESRGRQANARVQARQDASCRRLRATLAPLRARACEGKGATLES